MYPATACGLNDSTTLPSFKIALKKLQIIRFKHSKISVHTWHKLRLYRIY